MTPRAGCAIIAGILCVAEIQRYRNNRRGRWDWVMLAAFIATAAAAFRDG